VPEKGKEQETELNIAIFEVNIETDAGGESTSSKVLDGYGRIDSPPTSGLLKSRRNRN